MTKEPWMKNARIGLFFLFVPVTILLVVPLFLGSFAFPNDHLLEPLRPLGALYWIPGGSLTRASARALFVIGNGSPSPAAPPKNFVTSGPFRFTRNPLYLGGFVVLLGHALFFQSSVLLVYILLLLFVIRSIVVFREEPSLRRQFGETYVRDCREVPRWVGRRGAGNC
jgi:protein-S-isoprenylcysteine O-methyltransferase Ste14